MARIGCSGWGYKDWKGPFYPADMKDKDRLAFYAARFDTTEINASFYRLPTPGMVEGWAAAAPPGFVFAWKAWRAITHYKRLLDVEHEVAVAFERMAPLGEAFGPVIFQLPPGLKRDDQRLADFLKLLPKARRCAVEFRHPSWYEKPVFDLLADHNRALIISDHHYAPAPSLVTADWAYWRGHGPGGRYAGHYPEAVLETLAADIGRWRTDGIDAYAYFDNTMAAAATFDALKLKDYVAAGG